MEWDFMQVVTESRSKETNIRASWLICIMRLRPRYFSLLGEQDYSGIFCAQNDAAGTPVMTFSAVGGNESLWGVRYETENGRH